LPGRPSRGSSGPTEKHEVHRRDARLCPPGGRDLPVLYLLANKAHLSAEIHGDALVFAAVAGLAGLVLAIFAGASVATILAIPHAYAALALGLAGPTVYLAIWPSLLIGVDRAYVVYRAQFLLGALNGVVVLGLWAIRGLSLSHLITWTAIWWLFSVALEGFILLRIHRPTLPQPRKHTLIYALGYGLRLYPGGLANWVHFRSDQFVVGNALGTAAVGIYAVSARWAELLLLIGYGAAAAGMHRIASSTPVEAHAFARRLAITVTGMTAAGGLVLCLLAPIVIPWLYGEAFRGAVLPLVILAPGIIAWDAARILSQYISYNTGRPEIPASFAVVGAIANVAIAVAVVPTLGIVGAALASTVTYCGVVGATWIAFLGWGRAPQAD
jgi:O-antigen/teichoic acid export membrane protein